MEPCTPMQHLQQRQCPCTLANGATSIRMHLQTGPLALARCSQWCQHEWGECMHCPAIPMAWCPIGYRPIVGCGPQVGTLDLKDHLFPIISACPTKSDQVHIFCIPSFSQCYLIGPYMLSLLQYLPFGVALPHRFLDCPNYVRFQIISENVTSI